MTYTSISGPLPKTDQYISLIECQYKKKNHNNIVQNRMNKFEETADCKVRDLSPEKRVMYDLQEAAYLKALDVAQAQAEFL